MKSFIRFVLWILYALAMPYLLTPLIQQSVQAQESQYQDEDDVAIYTYKPFATFSVGAATIQKLRVSKELKEKKTSDGKNIYIAEAYKTDKDGDGVADISDKCIDTPPTVKIYFNMGEDSVEVRTSRQEAVAITQNDNTYIVKAWVDATGCFPDSDGDKVPDYNDHCPDTPFGKKVDKVGCPEGDTDGDGIPDKRDDCPNEPGLPKFNGCPDCDNDGIPDKQDDCPCVAGKAEFGGCPDKPEDEDLLIIQAATKVVFEPNSAIIDMSSAYVLDNFIELVHRKFPKANIALIGHTDNRPVPDSDNQTLSEKRAQAVKDYLTEKGGIAITRISAAGKGESEPIDTNETDTGRANNRRVEINLEPVVEQKKK